jgi:hypothetical protein
MRIVLHHAKREAKLKIRCTAYPWLVSTGTSLRHGKLVRSVADINLTSMMSQHEKPDVVRNVFEGSINLTVASSQAAQYHSNRGCAPACTSVHPSCHARSCLWLPSVRRLQWIRLVSIYVDGIEVLRGAMGARLQGARRACLHSAMVAVFQPMAKL